MSSPASSSPLTRQLLRQYEMPRRMVLALSGDFTDEEATRPAGGQKPLVWYLGHIALTDNYLLTLFGDESSALTAEHNERFGRGSDGHADFSDASKAEMLDILEATRGRVTALLSSLAPEDLDREARGEAVHPSFKTLGSALALVVSHCAYHAGQIGDLRREMGKNPMFG
jgi:uncharacterized damage-inducible protein DinB